jgi:DNA polymerase elongation subunit (family B)
VLRRNAVKKPKILIYDLETSPNTGFTWGKWEQNVLAFSKEWEILSIAYKWSGEKTVHCHTRRGQKSDKALVQKIHALFREADVLVAHNGDEFDQKKAAARMLYHGMSPPKVLTSIDTKKVAKRHFKFNGNGLDDLGQFLGLGKKIRHTGFDLWLGCMSDDPKSWALMAKYNRQDVVLLEKVYERFKPWIQNHPHIGKLLYPNEGGRCPSCGSAKTKSNGVRVTQATVKQQRFCRDCGSYFTVPLPKEKK